MGTAVIHASAATGTGFDTATGLDTAAASGCTEAGA